MMFQPNQEPLIDPNENLDPEIVRAFNDGFNFFAGAGIDLGLVRNGDFSEAIKTIELYLLFGFIITLSNVF